MELIENIAKSLKIQRYRNELWDDYVNRVVFCFAVSWINMIVSGSMHKTDDNEDVVGVDILYIKKKVSKKLDCLFDLYPNSKSYFGVEKSAFDAVSIVFEELEKCKLLLKIDARKYCGFKLLRYDFENWSFLKGGVENQIRVVDKSFCVGLGRWTTEEIGEKCYSDIVYSKRNIDANAWFASVDSTLTWEKLHLEGGEIDIYLSSNKSNIQAYRWAKFEEKYLNDGGINLARFDKYKFGLIKVVNGHMVYTFLNQWYIENSEIYRIMYYFDIKSNNTVNFFYKSYGEEFYELSLSNPIPFYENVLIRICGWRKSWDKNNENYYKFIIDKRLWSVVRQSLENLGIALEEI